MTDECPSGAHLVHPVVLNEKGVGSAPFFAILCIEQPLPGGQRPSHIAEGTYASCAGNSADDCDIGGGRR